MKGDLYPDSISEIKQPKFSNMSRQFDMVLNMHLIGIEIKFK